MRLACPSSRYLHMQVLLDGLADLVILRHHSILDRSMDAEVSAYRRAMRLCITD